MTPAEPRLTLSSSAALASTALEQVSPPGSVIIPPTHCHRRDTWLQWQAWILAPWEKKQMRVGCQETDSLGLSKRRGCGTNCWLKKPSLPLFQTLRGAVFYYSYGSQHILTHTVTVYTYVSQPTSSHSSLSHSAQRCPCGRHSTRYKRNPSKSVFFQ